ncbi:ABC transporter family protein [Cryptosporidium muris RN66]|uniref:ABC transporter family protein n=1 Tax=Cryptosporidium muris (strain RN66) TaxID=441375 RepID=B6AGM7_CRYMR|nr:ABC transporter family protein [Cryptosporidium muris RN66]EEA07368.1 ABC transporter family protein [Cryptosporidium muris RN66]|eukprot:XP_002141717.1 ABC transporter family protein [Cryptosporidium muris RN66]
MSSFIENDPKENEGKCNHSKYPNMFKRGIINTLLFTWLHPIINSVHEGNILTDEEMKEVDDDTCIETEYESFLYNWKNEFSNQVRSELISTIKVIYRTFGIRILYILLLKFFYDITSSSEPWQVYKILSWLNNPNSTTFEGIWRFGLLVLSEISRGFILQQYLRRSFSLATMLRGVVGYTVSGKVINISKTLASENISKCLNLISSESMSILISGNTLLVAPSMIFQNILLLILLYKFVGISSLIGYSIIIFSLYLNTLLIKRNQAVRLKYIDVLDKRISLSTEFISFFRQIKCYAWENYYLTNISKIRDKEIKHLSRWRLISQLGNVLATACVSISPVLTFGTYLSLKGDFEIDILFSSLMIFELLQQSLIMLPLGINTLQKTINCYNRLTEILLLEEVIKPNKILDLDLDLDLDPDVNTETSIIIKNLVFGWSRDEITLHSINANVNRGELVGIIGPVGCGKTTLLELILQEILPSSGIIRTSGQIAYCSQSPWIIDSTIRHNILLDLPYDEKWYQTVVNSCSLNFDLKVMPNGDLTEIGEKGINLSGGQKQRIGLARAIYQRSDTLLLDDILSALDNTVANQIFRNLILKLLKGNKTVIMVTNKLDILSFFDRVIFIKNKTIAYAGPPDKNFINNKDYEVLLQSMQKIQKELSQTVDDIVTLEEISEIEMNNDKYSIKSDITLESMNYRNLFTSSETTSRRGSRVSMKILRDKYRRESDILTNDKKSSESSLSSYDYSSKKMSTEQVFTRENENISLGKIKKSIYISYIKDNTVKWCILVVLLIYSHSACSLLSSLWISKWSLNINAYGKLYGLLVLFGISALQPIFSFLFRSSNIYMASRASGRIYHKIVEKLAYSKMQFYEFTPIGRIISRITNDIVIIDEVLPQNMNDFLFALSRISFSIGYFIYLDIRFALLFLALCYFFIGIRNKALNTNRQLKRIFHTKNAPIISKLTYLIEGLPILRCTDNSLNVFDQEVRDLIDSECRPWRCYCLIQRWLGIRIDFIGACVNFTLGILCIFTKKYLSVASIGIAFQYSNVLTHLIIWITRVVSEAENNFLSYERIQEYIENIPQEYILNSYNSNKSNLKHINISENENKELLKSLIINIDNINNTSKWPLKGKIVFKNVYLQYNNTGPIILNNLNFTINGGVKVGICGRTGSGKSSLLSVLLRLYDIQNGEILIDGINILDIDLRVLRSAITIIPQEPNIMTGSLRYNVDPFNEYSDSEVMKALARSNAQDFVNNLPDGIHTLLSSSSNNLSMGQRQLVCLTRALLRNSKIILLDEATASVDIATDDIIQKTIQREFSECTILSIAHRIHTIINFDLIIVLDNGYIAEFDTPQNLLANTSSIFYSLATQTNTI